VKPKFNFATGLALGAGAGAALGVATHNLAVGVALGTAIGMVLGRITSQEHRGVAVSVLGSAGILPAVARACPELAEEASRPRRTSVGENRWERNEKGMAYGSSEQIEVDGAEHRDWNRDRNPGRNSLQPRCSVAPCRNLRRHRGRCIGRPQEMSRVRSQTTRGHKSCRSER